LKKRPASIIPFEIIARVNAREREYVASLAVFQAASVAAAQQL
jgi:hypothetical protein